MTYQRVLCQLCMPGSERPRAISAQELADGTSIDVCAMHLHQMLEARLWLRVESGERFPTPDQIRAVLTQREVMRERTVH